MNALKRFGIEAQLTIAVEEMAELTHAICKMKRYPKAKMHLDHVKEELADCSIILSQLITHFGADEIERIVEYKLDRLKKTIEEQFLSEPPASMI